MCTPTCKEKPWNIAFLWLRKGRILSFLEFFTSVSIPWTILLQSIKTELCILHEYLYWIEPIILLIESMKMFIDSINIEFIFSSVQFSRSVVSNSLQSHESQHARPPCPSPTPGVHSDSRPSSQWCHPAISSSVVPFSSCPHPSQHQSLFQWVNSSHEVAEVLEFQL